jgi:hypothetical protein
MCIGISIENWKFHAANTQVLLIAIINDKLPPGCCYIPFFWSFAILSTTASFVGGTSPYMGPSYCIAPHVSHQD